MVVSIDGDGTASYAKYLAGEERGSTKHEYVHGAVFAMAGGILEHGALQVAVASALVVALRDKPCRDPLAS